MNIYLVRHTLPAVEQGVCYGQTDLDVVDSFEHELSVLKPKLAFLVSPTIFSSPLQRCLKLASKMAEHLDTSPVQIDGRLVELDFGDWELKNWADIPQGIVAEWTDEHINQAPPNGESYVDLYQRAKQFLDALVARGGAEDKLVVTHAGVIRALVVEVLNVPLTQASNIEVGYGSVTHIIVENGVTRIGFVSC